MIRFKDVVFTEDEENPSAAARLELRVGRKLYALGPAIGLMANTDGGVFGYGGVYIEVAWGDILITPLVGLGGYAEGDSKDLGGVFQFLASGTVASSAKCDTPTRRDLMDGEPFTFDRDTTPGRKWRVHDR